MCSELLLWWLFYNALAFLKCLIVTPVLVTKGKESSMTIKETDFPTVMKPKCVRFIHAHWALESTMDTLAREFPTCQIILN
jgi:hypothetical protein